MAKFRGTCFYCRSQTLFEIRAARIKKPSKLHGTPSVVHMAVDCPVCKNYSVVTANLDTFSLPIGTQSVEEFLVNSPMELDSFIEILKTVPTTPDSPNLHVPHEVLDLFEDAHKNLYELREPSPRMAVIALRSTLEQAFKMALKKPTDDSTSLVNLIELAHREHLITQALRDWADALRLKGNIAAHTTIPISQDYAEELYHFAEILLTVLFDLPARIQEFRQKAL